GNVQQDDWIGDLAHVCSGWDHAAMSAMRNCVSRFRQMIGSRSLFCKCHSSAVRLWSHKTSPKLPAFAVKAIKHAALAQCPLCEIQFRKFDFQKMEDLPCAAPTVNRTFPAQLRTLNGCCWIPCRTSTTRRRIGSSWPRWREVWNCCVVSARARTC